MTKTELHLDYALYQEAARYAHADVATALSLFRETFGSSIAYAPHLNRYKTEDILLHTAKLAGKVIGACIASTELGMTRYGWIDYIAVEKERRGQNIGKALVEQVESTFRALGQKESRLSPVTSNPQTMRFWRNIGYVYNNNPENPVFLKVL